ncbi:MAG: glycogen synthase GlgA [Mariniblastus sp.]|nr:glycogen synthase GlgA [Mariniblastus sp.]
MVAGNQPGDANPFGHTWQAMLKICFITSELAPLAKVGGLADVSQALPLALAELGHDVRVIVPYYREFQTAPDHNFIRTGPFIELKFGSHPYSFQVLEGEFPSRDHSRQTPQLHLVDCPELFDRPAIYGDSEEEHLRFLMLSRGAIEICQRMKWAPDIFHVNDWQTAMLPLLLKTVYGWDRLFDASRSVLTIHNIGHQGVFPADILEDLNLGPAETLLHQQDLSEGRINFLKTGLLYSDLLTAVSPTYAREIQTADYGMGLEQLLSARRSLLQGIVNGIDTDVWNPATDELITARFSVADRSGKRQNKTCLLETMGLEPNPGAPVVGIVSRLTHQKGFETLYESMPILLSENDLRLVVLGSGETQYIDFFEQLKRQFSDKVAFHEGFDNRLAHQIEAGSDIFLMPSRYEPCGLNQMYSQTYGTIPVVRNTGGLADTVIQYDESTGRGTGILFDEFTNQGVLWGVRRALQLYQDPDQWYQIVSNAMMQDFSWNRSARQYAELFERLSQLSPTEPAAKTT